MSQDLGLRFAMVNPLEHRAAIVELFVADGSDRFPGHFDRVFPGEVAAGMESCVALEPGGRIVLHIARFVNRFWMDGEALTGGLTAHLIADRPYRTLKPAVLLVRHLIAEERSRGALDFLYTTTGPRTVPVLKLGGFAECGSAGRFVRPISDPRLIRRGVARIHNALLAARLDPTRETAIGAVAALDLAVVDELLRGQDHPREPGLVPMTSRTQMARWLPHFPGDDDLIVREIPFESHGPYVTLRLDPSSHVADVTSLNEAGLRALPRLVGATVATLRDRGIWRLTLIAPRKSPLAKGARRAGFFERPDGAAIMGIGISRPGIAALEAVHQWRLCASDFDGTGV